MVMDNREFEDVQSLRRDRSRAALIAVEATRAAAKPPPATSLAAAPAARDKIPLFWEIFGGTIVSIVALIAITAYSQLGSAITDLRRDVNQLQTQLVRKDDLNLRLSAVWTSVKDLQATTASRTGVEENTNVLRREFGICIKTDDDQRRDLQRQFEEMSRRVQALAERLVSIEAAYRLTALSRDTGK